MMPNMKHHVEYADLAEIELAQATKETDGDIAHYHVRRAQVYATLAVASVREEALVDKWAGY